MQMQNMTMGGQRAMPMVGTLVLLMALSLGVFFIALNSSLLRRSVFFSLSSYSSPFSVFEESPVFVKEQTLEEVLEGASKNGTLILTTVNEAWAARNSVLDLFLEGFRIGEGTAKLLDQLVIVALDDQAHRRCLKVHKHCFSLVSKGFDFHQDAYFMTRDYVEMMWRRVDFLRSVLELGYDFVFTDADVLWFRDPFQRFYPNADFQIACDHFFGDSFDLHNRPNGGFVYVKSNNWTIDLYKYWYAARERYPGYHDQDVLNFIKFDPIILNSRFKFRFLDTAYFGGLCEPSRDLNLVSTMHTNCCIGLGRKLHDLQLMLRDWKLFLSLPPNWKSSPSITWSVPKMCSMYAVQVHGAPAPTGS